jgi:alpha-amylase
MRRRSHITVIKTSERYTHAVSRYGNMHRVALVILLAIASVASLWAQAGFNDDRVLLQGFYWESYRHGYPVRFPTFGNKHWYAIVRSLAPAIRDGGFDVVWLPPPSYAGDFSAGYNPKQYFRLSNSYGTFNEHRAMLVALLQNGIEPIADIVINHRDGNTGWADFSNPVWGTWAICRTDEAFTNPASGLTNTPADQRGNCEEQADYRPEGTYNYDSFRDVAHTDIRVRRDIVRYLLQLKSMGYRGWRYDMVHGYHARWIALYNRLSQPTFSVGEYDWDKQAQQRGWVWNTATQADVSSADHLKTSSNVFDFQTQFSLKQINSGRYTLLYGFGNGIGLVGDNTDGRPWKQRAVTFLENHDTGYRTNEDGTPQPDHQFDSFANNWQVEQAYAQILTHPGVPCVYWKHYFDWGSDLQNKIRALINARKAAGINAGSSIDLQNNARQASVYAARVTGTKGELYVRIGGSDQQWQPSTSGYSDYREYAQGAGWKVWVKLPGNPPVQTVAHRPALPVPRYKPAEQIQLPRELQ